MITPETDKTVTRALNDARGSNITINIPRVTKFSDHIFDILTNQSWYREYFRDAFVNRTLLSQNGFGLGSEIEIAQNIIVLTLEATRNDTRAVFNSSQWPVLSKFVEAEVGVPSSEIFNRALYFPSHFFDLSHLCPSF